MVVSNRDRGRKALDLLKERPAPFAERDLGHQHGAG